jgi:hypothetical protein
MFRRTSGWLGLLLILLAATSAADQDTYSVAGSPTTVMEEIRQTELAGTAISVGGFRFVAGLATIHLLEGSLYPASNVGGRPVEMVFKGRGRIEVSPDDAVEQGQLELFTGAAALHETFSQAVFVLALDTAVDTLHLGQVRPIRANEERSVAAVLDSWLESGERKLLDVEARIMADALGDSLAARYFCGFFHGNRLGTFLYTVDPLADEQITLGQLVKPELDRRQQRQARWQLSHAQRQGKLLDIELADIGRWTTWVSCMLPGSDQVPGSPGLQALHYDHDVTISRRAPELTAVTRITLRVLHQGLRTATLTMHHDLTPLRVSDE